MVSKQVGFFGQPVSWYVDQGELSFVGLAAAVSLVYLISFWLELTYLDHLSPMILVFQVAAAAATAYQVGVRVTATPAQLAVACALIGAAGGILSAVWALFRFHYWWLALNLVAEPVWSALLAVAVGLLTFGFFKLPALVRSRANTQPT